MLQLQANKNFDSKFNSGRSHLVDETCYRSLMATCNIQTCQTDALINALIYTLFRIEMQHTHKIIQYRFFFKIETSLRSTSIPHINHTLIATHSD